MSDFCATKTELVYYGYVFPMPYALTLIMLSPLLYLYVVAYIKDDLQTSRILFYFGFVFFATILIFGVSGIIASVTWCHTLAISTAIYALTHVLYAVQIVMLLTTLLVRLTFIFKDSVFRVSECTIYAYSALLIVLIAGVIVYNTLRFVERTSDVRFALLAIEFVGYLFMLIWINYLFISRLLSVYQSCKDSVSKNDHLKHIATKNATLCIVSTATIIFNAIAILLRNRSLSVHTQLFVKLMVQVDVITNFLSILLTFKYFDPWYLKLCACCHCWCISYCDRVGHAQHRNEAMMVTEIQLQPSDTANAADI